MGFLSRLRNVKIQFNPSTEDLAGGPEAMAERTRQELETRPLLGPAGQHVYGPDPREPQVQAPRPVGVVSADRAEQAHHEWAWREAARQAYLAPGPAPVMFTRIATKASDASGDVAEHLAASGLAGRPDLVFGVYRVPDHIGRSGRRYEEWDIVHAATEPLAPAPLPEAVFLDARQQWVARSAGEASVLDEDLGVALLQGAGAGPDRCLGVTRLLATRAGDREDDRSFVKMAVTGVAVFAPAGASLTGTLDHLASAAPVVLSAGPPPGVHVEVANWVAVAKAIDPRTGAPYPVPSPFPYLPSTPQELLKAYLDIVGISPADCYSAQVTIDITKDVIDREQVGWMTATSTRGEPQPCVDGTDRSRLSGAARVVVAYRDRPEYEVGRERWSAYEQEVLQAQLDQRTGTRRPVPAAPPESGTGVRAARKAIGVAAGVASVVFDSVAADGADAVINGNGRDPFDDIPDTRYCWPPA